MTIASARQGRQGRRQVPAEIPVVVHVVYKPGANISDEQIHSQIEVLNRDFRATNLDVSTVPPAFADLVADAEIDSPWRPSIPRATQRTGSPERITGAAGFGTDEPSSPSRRAAPTRGQPPLPQHLGVRSPADCSATRNSLVGPPDTDGVVITYTGVRHTGTAAAPFHLGRTTTHEIGHWLNLFHIWGDDGSGCGGTDEIDDTPNQAGPEYGKPRSRRDLRQRPRTATCSWITWTTSTTT